jgi:hypothetical protein
MTNHKANTLEMTTSDADGNFKFQALPAGEYEMRVQKRGFEEYKAPQVVLEPGRESSQSVTLKVGVITEEVDVVAEGRVKALPAGMGGKPTDTGGVALAHFPHKGEVTGAHRSLLYL